MTQLSDRPQIVEELIEATCYKYGVSRNLALSKKQTPAPVAVRRLVSCELFARGYSCEQIGKWLNRHHTTIVALLGRKGAQIAERRELAARLGQGIPVPDYSGEWDI